VASVAIQAVVSLSLLGVVMRQRLRHAT